MTGHLPSRQLLYQEPKTSLSVEQAQKLPEGADASIEGASAKQILTCLGIGLIQLSQRADHEANMIQLSQRAKRREVDGKKIGRRGC